MGGGTSVAPSDMSLPDIADDKIDYDNLSIIKVIIAKKKYRRDGSGSAAVARFGAPARAPLLAPRHLPRDAVGDAPFLARQSEIGRQAVRRIVLAHQPALGGGAAQMLDGGAGLAVLFGVEDMDFV